MRRFTYFILLIAILLLTAACKRDDLPQAAPIHTPTQTPSITPSPTHIPTAVFSFPTPEALPFLAWVNDFANPILVAIVDKQPNFHDEFNSQLNKGWFYIISSSNVEPFYAHLSDDALILKLPDGDERHDAMVYNPKLARKNFVLSYDFKFGKTEPDDIFRFQFDQGEDLSVAVDLSKSEEWTFQWILHNNSQSTTGTYDYFSPELINVVIIVQGDQCAVLLNHDPLGYIKDCRSDPTAQPTLQAASLHLLSASGHNGMVTVDNVKLWDLDKIP